MAITIDLKEATPEFKVDLALQMLETSPFANIFFSITELLLLDRDSTYKPVEDKSVFIAYIKDVLMDNAAATEFILGMYTHLLATHHDDLRDQLEALIATVVPVKAEDLDDLKDIITGGKNA